MTTEINVMKAIWKIVLVVIIGASETVAAFDTSTHSAMTAAAAGKSRLGISPTFSTQIPELKGVSVICFTTPETPDQVGCGGNWACRQDTPKQLTLTPFITMSATNTLIAI